MALRELTWAVETVAAARYRTKCVANIHIAIMVESIFANQTELPISARKEDRKLGNLSCWVAAVAITSDVTQ
jgi:hypothetical protein